MRQQSPGQPRRPLFRGRSRLAQVAAIACAVLLVALVGGTAEAARHYLITSTTQIKPRVLKALRGRTGATGATRATGAAGQTVTLLPSGETETGAYFAEGTATTVGDLAAASISFALRDDDAQLSGLCAHADRDRRRPLRIRRCPAERR